MKQKYKDRLLKGANNFGLGLTAQQLSYFEEFADNLIFWNRIAGITANRGIGDIVDSMFLDSLAFNILGFDISGLKTCDFGTGGGFPGVPLKITYEKLDISLIDSSSKKCSFLEQISKNFGFEDFSVFCERGGTSGFKSRFSSSFDLVFSRACADTGKLVELICPLLKQGGRLIAWKGPLWNSEIENSKQIMDEYNVSLEGYHDYSILDTEAVKTLVIIKKGF